ncbi:hypothetical protein B0T10DRAFT_30769 [Thelonectria olida]|uniref:Uncharacterized protein n=1 Tax=Thelonectria olida TaxID=1576542 RepID=A0A9P8WI77_9HYPO|nr:hypothetical protein B0T10DRAFT_30769 [Thelonectria olida]
MIPYLPPFSETSGRNSVDCPPDSLQPPISAYHAPIHLQRRSRKERPPGFFRSKRGKSCRGLFPIKSPYLQCPTTSNEGAPRFPFLKAVTWPVRSWSSPPPHLVFSPSYSSSGVQDSPSLPQRTQQSVPGWLALLFLLPMPQVCPQTQVPVPLPHPTRQCSFISNPVFALPFSASHSGLILLPTPPRNLFTPLSPGNLPTSQPEHPAGLTLGNLTLYSLSYPSRLCILAMSFTWRMSDKKQLPRVTPTDSWRGRYSVDPRSYPSYIKLRNQPSSKARTARNTRSHLKSTLGVLRQDG